MKNLVLAAAAAFTLALPSVGMAATQVSLTGYSFANGSQDGVLHLATSPYDGATASFGQFKLTGTSMPGNTPLTLYSYCVDLFHGFGVPAIFDVVPLSTLFTGTKAANINKLLANTTPATADQSAAVQLAMWEIVFETNATLNVASGGAQGAFYATAGSSSTARTLANGYLSQLASWTAPTNGTAKLLVSEGNQTQVFFQLAPEVPEPATWGMMIVGVGAIGSVMRRRKQTYVLA